MFIILHVLHKPVLIVGVAQSDHLSSWDIGFMDIGFRVYVFSTRTLI